MLVSYLTFCMQVARCCILGAEFQNLKFAAVQHKKSFEIKKEDFLIFQYGVGGTSLIKKHMMRLICMVFNI